MCWINVNISKFDALIISGGGDINPNVYGQDIGDKTTRISDSRDSTELKLFKSAEKNKVKHGSLLKNGIVRGLPVDLSSAHVSMKYWQVSCPPITRPLQDPYLTKIRRF